MARQIPWTAWILFFAGMPILFADHPCAHAVGRYFGWGWGSGYHYCSPNGWYGAGGCGVPCNTCNTGCNECGTSMVPWDGAMLNPAHHAAVRYYVPPIAYQPYVAQPARTASAQNSSRIAAPSTLQSR